MGLKAFLKLAVKQDAVFVVNNENRRVLVVIDRIKPVKDVLNIQVFHFVFAVLGLLGFYLIRPFFRYQTQLALKTISIHTYNSC